MNLFDRLSGLAYKALNNKTAAPAKTAGGQTPDWTSTLRGTVEGLTRPSAAPPAAASRPVGPTRPSEDDPAASAAVARYDYLLRTAEPAQLERIHAEAFARLTPEQRDQLHTRLRTELPPEEHPRTSQPADLARTATRAEAARPGVLVAWRRSNYTVG